MGENPIGFFIPLILPIIDWFILFMYHPVCLALKEVGEYMRILLVEDERKLSSVIKRGLKEVHYAVDLAENSDDALFMAETNPYDLIILDIMIPGKDGIAICQAA